MVIPKGNLFSDGKPLVLQKPPETSGIADGGKSEKSFFRSFRKEIHRNKLPPFKTIPLGERQSGEKNFFLRKILGDPFFQKIHRLRRNLIILGDNRHVSPGYSPEPFPEKASGKMLFVAEGAGGVDEQNVHIPSHAAVLKGIVRHHHGTPFPGKSSHALTAVRRESHGNFRQRGGEEKGLVPHDFPLALAVSKYPGIANRSSVPPADNTRRKIRLQELPGQHGHEGGFVGPSQGEISHADHRKRRLPGASQSPIVKKITPPGIEASYASQRSENAPE